MDLPQQAARMIFSQHVCRPDGFLPLKACQNVCMSAYLLRLEPECLLVSLPAQTNCHEMSAYLLLRAAKKWFIFCPACLAFFLSVCKDMCFSSFLCLICLPTCPDLLPVCLSACFYELLRSGLSSVPPACLSSVLSGL
jgi:hypothetical protein